VRRAALRTPATSYDQTVDDDQFQQIAKTVADPSRLAALQMIATQGEASCSDVRGHLCLTAATVSHHVKELAASGLVQLRREAKFVYLRLNRAVWTAYLKELKRRVPRG
jgi:ArsR family transcriptional regulator, arsenate/arsenite/antimonite-responsive transcriptional repressor